MRLLAIYMKILIMFMIPHNNDQQWSNKVGKCLSVYHSCQNLYRCFHFRNDHFNKFLGNPSAPILDYFYHRSTCYWCGPLAQPGASGHCVDDPWSTALCLSAMAAADCSSDMVFNLCFQTCFGIVMFSFEDHWINISGLFFLPLRGLCE